MLKKIIYIVLALAVVAFTVYKMRSNKETAQKRVFQYNKEKPVSVQILTVKAEKLDNVTVFPGNFEPYMETKLSADIQGKITAVLVDLGSTVQK